jgi:hypothetical protein
LLTFFFLDLSLFLEILDDENRGSLYFFF